jgi:hypothetical protein
MWRARLEFVCGIARSGGIGLVIPFAMARHRCPMRSERNLVRFALRAPVEFNLWDLRRNFFAFATDISVGGAFIETAFPASALSAVALRMWPWGWGEEVMLAGIVRWKGATGMGVQFVSVGPREARAIRDAVADWHPPYEAPRNGDYPADG